MTLTSCPLSPQSQVESFDVKTNKQKEKRKKKGKIEIEKVREEEK